MSWQVFKDNVSRVINNPDNIPDIDTVANILATEYDAAMKSGYDSTNNISVKSGDVESMKAAFKSALLKGQTSTTPYDLVGELGTGVIQYWTKAILNEFPIPKIPAPGTTSNIAVTSATATIPGVWTPPVVIPATVDSLGENPFTLTEPQIQELQIELETAQVNFENDLLVNDFTSAEADSLEIAYASSQLQVGESFGIEVQPGFDLGGNEIEILSPTTTYINSDNSGTSGKADTSGPTQFKILFTPNMSLGQKVVAIATTDLKNGVAANPKGSNSGNARIAQMLNNGGIGSPAAWCASAVTTWWKEAGAGLPKGKNKTGSGHAGCTTKNWNCRIGLPYGLAYVPDWRDWAADTGRWVSMENGQNQNYVPTPGSAIVFGWGTSTEHGGYDHIGIVESTDKKGNIYSIEGNAGDAVKRRACNKKSIRGIIILS
jgi:hypothetical protein